MTHLESKLETEMVKMARMVKDSISSLATQMERGMTELRKEFKLNLKFQSLSTGVNAALINQCLKVFKIIRLHSKR